MPTTAAANPDDDAQAAFLGLFLAHQRELCGFALARGIPACDLDDVMQDAATVLWSKFADYQPGTNFRAWAFQVLRFMVLRRRTAMGHRRFLHLDSSTEEAITALESDTQDSALDLPVDLLHACLATLGRHARELVHLRYQEGLEPGEIARRWRVSPGSLRVRLHRIRSHLLDCIRQRQREEHHA